MLQKFTVILSVAVHGDYLMQCVCVTEVWCRTSCSCLPSAGYCCSAFRRDQVEKERKELQHKGQGKIPSLPKTHPWIAASARAPGDELLGWWWTGIYKQKPGTLLLDVVVLPVLAACRNHWVVPACAWPSWRIGEATTISQCFARTSLFLPGCKDPGCSPVSLISCLNSNFVDFCSSPESSWKD